MKQIVTYSSNLPKSIQEVKRCVVKITSESGTGSGFFVSDEGYIITNYHVVEASYKGSNSVVQVELAAENIAKDNFVVRANFRQIDGIIVDVDMFHDLALIKLTINPFKTKFPPFARIYGIESNYLYGKPRFSRRSLVDGNPIAISGYPLNQPVLITNSGVVASVFGEYSYKVPAGKSASGNDAFYADMQINHGNSGGPAYLAETGEIIGVAVAFLFAQKEVASLQTSNQESLEKFQNLYNTTTNPEMKTLIEVIANLQSATVYNSGLGVIIPLKFVTALLNKNNVKI